MLAVVWAVQNFRPYLYARKFLIFSDHKPITSNSKDTPARILRWKLKLAEYDFEIQHKPGSKISNADALSRINHEYIGVMTRSKTKTKENPTTPESHGEPSTIEAGKSCTTTEVDEPFGNTEIVSNPKVEVVYDKDIQQQIIREFHTSRMGGHSGVFRTYKRIRLQYYWPKMLREICSFIKSCDLCKANKVCRNTKVPLMLTTTAREPFEKVAFDIVGPLSVTENLNRYILTFQDELTKFSGAIPIQNQEAETVAKAMTMHFVTKFGAPKTLLTDLGANFTSKVFNELCKLFKIKHLTTTAYHPESNGSLERSHRTLKDFLRIFAEKDKENWDDMIHYATFVYNTTPHCTTKYTPYELVFGRQANIPSSIKKSPEPVYTYDDFVAELQARLRVAHMYARSHIVNNKLKTKTKYDESTKELDITIGDLVWLKNNGRKNKMDPPWLGPYPVTEIHNAQNTSILIGKKTNRVHNNRLKKNE